MIVDPFPVPRVKDEHVDGMFGCLTDVIQARIEYLERQGGSGNAERVRFWKFALENLDPEVHAKIQKKYLRAGETVRLTGLPREEGGSRLPDMVKYIDPIVWLESKLRKCREIGLHESKPLSILDIGTGPGHFPFAARFDGHRVVGLDFPQEVNTGKAETFLYDDLCEFYRVPRVGFEIKAGESLVELGERFDLVTSFLASFNVKRDVKNRPVWTPADWEDFLDRCFKAWLKPGGRMIMTVDRNKVNKDCWEYLASRAAKADPEMRFVEIHSPAPGA